ASGRYRPGARPGLHNPTRRARRRSTAAHASAGVDDLDAAVTTVRVFALSARGRLLFAVRDGRDLAVGDAVEHQHATHGLCAAVAETDVVLARAALVGVPLERHTRVRV